MKNYTSRVPVSQTVADIERLLIRAGARSIQKEYSAIGEIAAINFMLLCPETNAPIGVRLPANPEMVCECLMVGRKNRDKATRERVLDQAKRTAWRLMFDWVAVQLSLIEMKQAEAMQVFLPYLWAGKSTFYESIKQDNFKALGYSATE